MIPYPVVLCRFKKKDEIRWSRERFHLKFFDASQQLGVVLEPSFRSGVPQRRAAQKAKTAVL
jgi:hypothetical protein